MDARPMRRFTGMASKSSGRNSKLLARRHLERLTSRGLLLFDPLFQVSGGVGVAHTRRFPHRRDGRPAVSFRSRLHGMSKAVCNAMIKAKTTVLGGGNAKASFGADTRYVAGRLWCTVRSNGLPTYCFCRRPMGRGRKLPCLFVSCRVRRRSQCGVSCAMRGHAVLQTWIPAEGRSIRSRCPPRCRLCGSAFEQRATYNYVPWGLTSFFGRGSRPLADRLTDTF